MVACFVYSADFGRLISRSRMQPPFGLSSILPSFTLFLFGSLTFLHQLLLPLHSLSLLIVPAISWAILFLSSAVALSLQTRRESFEVPTLDSLGRITRNETKAAIYLLASYLCGVAAGANGISWSNVCSSIDYINL